MAVVNYPLSNNASAGTTASSPTTGTAGTTATTGTNKTTPKTRYSELVSADVAAAQVGLEGQTTEAINNKVRITSPVKKASATTPAITTK